MTYASIQADIQLLLATLVPYAGRKDPQPYDDLINATKELAKKLPPAPSKIGPLTASNPEYLDGTIQIAEALASIGGALATSVAPYGTVTSAV